MSDQTPESASRARDAVGWHSEIAEGFDARYQDSPAFRERLAVWSGLIERYADQSALVLDAGCGSGVLSVVAARRAHAVVAFDGSAEMIALAEAKKRAEGLTNLALHVARLEDAAALDTRRFDLVLASSVLEYQDDLWRAFDILAARLKPGGVIVFSMPNGHSLYRLAEELAFRTTGRPAYYAHVRSVPTQTSVRRSLAGRGFDVLESCFYAPTPLLSRVARPLGCAALADNLFAVACRAAGRPSG